MILEQFKDLVKRNQSSGAKVKLRSHVNISGGEPFIRDDIFDLLEILAADSELYSFGILTNGTLIDGPTARRLNLFKPRYVQVSIEGSRSTNDGVRGKGAYEQTVEGIRNLTSNHIPAVISFTAAASNYPEFPEVARLGCELGAARVWADRLIPVGRGTDFRHLLLSPGQTHDFFEIMYQARKQAERSFFRTEVSMRRALQFLVGGGEAYHCSAGDGLVTVMPNGDLYPCRRLPIKVGNLMEKPLIEWYDSSGLFQALRSHRVSEGCRSCRFSSECRGGLRCLAYAVTGDPFAPDPGCWRVECRRNKESASPDEAVFSEVSAGGKARSK